MDSDIVTLKFIYGVKMDYIVHCGMQVHLLCENGLHNDTQVHLWCENGLHCQAWMTGDIPF